MDIRNFQASIDSIDGLLFVDAETRQVAFRDPVSDSALRELLRVLKDDDAEFAFFDERYPSPSDPGAYFSYSPSQAPSGKWCMTFGNHGWSGGIYEIDDKTVCCQLMDLVSNGLLPSIQLDRVSFFAHYPVQSPARSKAVNKELLALHGGESR